MHTATWRGMALPILCLLSASCGKTDARDAAKTDPSKPAVVELGMPKLPEPVKEPPRPIVDENQLVVKLAQNYSLLAAAMVNGDARMIGSLYAPDAEFSMPDGAWSGVANIATNLASLGRQKSLSDFQRRTARHLLTDSTVVDSGAFLITIKRAGADSVYERGSYATRWRIKADGNWLMERDMLTIARKKKDLR
jgi:hypothetical protein